MRHLTFDKAKYGINTTFIITQKIIPSKTSSLKHETDAKTASVCAVSLTRKVSEVWRKLKVFDGVRVTEAFVKGVSWRL